MTTPNNGIQSETSHHEHHDDHGAAPLPFSDADIAGFRSEDIHAAKMVVLEMTGIFAIGIIIYILVALTTWPTVNTL